MSEQTEKAKSSAMEVMQKLVELLVLNYQISRSEARAIIRECLMEL